MSSDSIPPPDQVQRDRIEFELDQSMLVEAAAGTGKTTSMIHRMIALLKTGKCEIGTLAAVTFTRKAASQIRTRFQVALEKSLASAQSRSDDIDALEAERLSAALEHQQRCFIGTIHSFCARLLRERPVEADVPLDFSEIDDPQDGRLRRMAWRQYVDSLLAIDAPIVEELEEVGLRINRSVSGRRKVVDELEELGLELPQLGAAFTMMAGFPDVTEWPTVAREMPDVGPARAALTNYLLHLESLNLRERAAGNCNLMPKINQLTLAARHMGLEETVALMSLLEHFEPTTTKPVQKNWETKQLAKDEEARWLAFREQWAVPLLRAWREHRYERIIRALRPALEIYDDLRKEMGALNFEDLLLRARDLLLQPQVRRYFRRRITHLLVDEFQDTDPLQAEIMMLLTASDVHERDWRDCRPEPGSLFVVGDPKQSIYRFRRADMEIYFTVRRILSQCAAVVSLSANFRSTEDVIQWVNTSFEDVFPAELTRHQAPQRTLEHGGAKATLSGAAIERPLLDETATAGKAAHEEAAWIAARASQLLAETPELKPSDFLVLTWRKARLRVYAEALQRAGVPHEVTGGNEINTSPELALLRNLLRAVNRPDDQVALLAVLRGELFGISDQALYAWRQADRRLHLYSPTDENEAEDAAADDQGPNTSQVTGLVAALKRLRQYHQWLLQLPVPIAVERIVHDAGLMANAAAASSARAGAFGKALELLRSGAIDGSAADLIERIDGLVNDEERRDGVPAVAADQMPIRVMNLHQAKGLEAKVVFLADPSGSVGGPILSHIDRSGDVPRGYLAIYSARMARESYRRQHRLLACPVGWDQLEAEERQFLDAEKHRLMYVAATRACEKTVCCPRDAHQNPWSFFSDRIPSQAAKISHAAAGDRSSLASEAATTAETPETVEAANQRISERWAASRTSSFHLHALKELSLKDAPKKPAGDDKDGAFWGSAVHTVLEVLLLNPQADPRQTAIVALREQGLRQQRAGELLEILKGVRASAIWQRAMKSSQRYCEAPVCLTLPEQLAHLGDPDRPTLTRGVIDLVFREGDGWVIIDYKSDRVELIEVEATAKHYQPQLAAYAAAWEHLSLEPVIEMGVLFTHHSRYIRMR